MSLITNALKEHENRKNPLYYAEQELSRIINKLRTDNGQQVLRDIVIEKGGDSWIFYAIQERSSYGFITSPEKKNIIDKIKQYGSLTRSLDDISCLKGYHIKLEYSPSCDCWKDVMDLRKERGDFQCVHAIVYKE